MVISGEGRASRGRDEGSLGWAGSDNQARWSMVVILCVCASLLSWWADAMVGSNDTSTQRCTCWPKYENTIVLVV